MAASDEVFISIDTETAGPHPSHHALLSIGACLVYDPAQTFYVELKPDRPGSIPEAMAIHGLTLAELAKRGRPPAEALAQFEAWAQAQMPAEGRPVFVAFNAPFDWMFVADYFHRYLGRNPFGHAALDLKSFYMGLTGARWFETSVRHVAARYGRRQELTHHALRDALDQAILFRAMLEEARRRGWNWLPDPLVEVTREP
ncbi:MAG: 3'-5' exonuclease [Anaerolineae bacterium]|nr:3'-5' exonuclease [Anaerolineae bacterium]